MTRVPNRLDTDAAAHYNLAFALLKLDRIALIPESIRHFNRALELDPDYYNAADVLAFAYLYLGDKAKVAEYSTESVEIKKRLGIEDNASGKK